MTWLITGGAGYIGAHVARAMVLEGERVLVLDDLSSGVSVRLPETMTARHGVREMVETAWQGWLLHHPQPLRD